jgi:hypothetical protein
MEVSAKEAAMLAYGSTMNNTSGYQQFTTTLSAAHQQLSRARQLLQELSFGIEL